ncbi:tRNA (N6-isopentenyl adenosine(37)-C2)-methylthiotransferase MiaB [candidate division WOR-3 bacterium RBG_13_43_14]|uniref:tRNA-2-methylthio-N(6)-dimethylallyladenosine synthase n=1 Tax=candidate division WOR-3 bacterium RBG_13_43_14 TaxID=1802590 RepID=A0A1F4UHA4_UNCW3|nr:MAG: tRNA (N6-isopentenyl adenosine(37)-C2)-methylthiotransferase MiaB [candidate division WOR-3 bacterium RBG_13_43_14]
MKYKIITFGCQMNKKDSSLLQSILDRHDHKSVTAVDEADLILINTCSVRDHAENRAKSHIASLRRWHEEGDRLLGIIGCMAQRISREIMFEFPYIDFVLGPDAYRSIIRIVDELSEKRSRMVETSLGDETYCGLYADKTGITDFVAVMRGCSNFCSYCIVPFVRGPARSRSYEDILRETEYLIARGVKEIILIGQNVNEYRFNDMDFAELLARISRLEGLLRLRFLTSHPKDFDQRIINVVKENSVICEWFHLPLQSGNDRILDLMNRKYSAGKFRQLVNAIRDSIPEAAITSDIIVGFPGETEQEFQDTMHMVNELQFDDAFTYRFSPRAGTKAAHMSMLPEIVIKRRLHELIEFQNSIIKNKTRAMIGKTYEIMIEAKARDNAMRGKTRGNKNVVIDEKVTVGSIINVKIVEIRGRTPIGVRV